MKRETFVFAIDHRPILAQACVQRGLPEDRIVRFKRLAIEAADAARKARPDRASGLAVLLDDIYGQAAMARARELALPFGQPVERGGVTPLEFARPDWREAILGKRPAFIKVRLDGSPEDAPEARRAQEQKLLEISRACEETGVSFMPEPLLTGKPNDRTRAALLVRWIGELRDQGIKARWWKIEGLDDAAAAAQVAASLPPQEGLLILGKSAPLPQLRGWFAAASGSDTFQGFAIGRTIFWDPFLRDLDGAKEGEVIDDLSARLLAVIDAWIETR